MQETGTGKRRNDECCNKSEKQGKSSGCIACMGQTANGVNANTPN